jgi:predicted nucleotidyltransferase
MLTVAEQQIIEQYAAEFGVRAVWLFGSSLEEGSEARDIDLAVEGLPPERFFDFYARLTWALPKPVDLVDLSEPTLSLAPIIRVKGKRIYG